jgi:hypothetical protein
LDNDADSGRNDGKEFAVDGDRLLRQVKHD